jgi:hypothetical protein
MRRAWPPGRPGPLAGSPQLAGAAAGTWDRVTASVVLLRRVAVGLMIEVVRLGTPLCQRLGIEHPIFCAGMGAAAGPELVAAVSASAGLGVLGAAGGDPAAGRPGPRADRPAVRRQFHHRRSRLSGGP